MIAIRSRVAQALRSRIVLETRTRFNASSLATPIDSRFAAGGRKLLEHCGSEGAERRVAIDKVRLETEGGVPEGPRGNARRWSAPENGGAQHQSRGHLQP